MFTSIWLYGILLLQFSVCVQLITIICHKVFLSWNYVSHPQSDFFRINCMTDRNLNLNVLQILFYNINHLWLYEANAKFLLSVKKNTAWTGKKISKKNSSLFLFFFSQLKLFIFHFTFTENLVAFRGNVKCLRMRI